MSAITDYDIVISGAGIAGLTLACLLADADFQVAVVEQRTPQPPAKEPELRVSAISRASLETFRQCGVLDALLADRATAFEQMHVWDVAGAGQVHFDSADAGLDTLGYIIENSRIQHALLAQLQAASNVELLCPASIRSIEDSDGTRTLLLEDDRRINCRLLVGADGVKSLVRTSAQIEFQSNSYEQSGLVCVVSTQMPHQHTAWQIFLADGPLAFLPMFRKDGADQCSIVWTLPSGQADELCTMPEQDFIEHLQKAFQHKLGDLELVSQRAVFPLQHGHANRYVQAGLALIGDAAHVIHPLAGQGANLGIADAASLAKLLLQASKAGRNWSALHTLRKYERARKGDNLLMETAMTGFNKLFSNEDQWLAMLRNAGLNLVDQTPLVKHRFMRHAMGL